MLTMAKLAVVGFLAAGAMSLVSGFSLHSGFHRPIPPVNVVHTTVKMYNPPPAHWLKGNAQPHKHGRHHHIRFHL